MCDMSRYAGARIGLPLSLDESRMWMCWHAPCKQFPRETEPLPNGEASTEKKGGSMPETLMEKLARPERQIVESEEGRRGEGRQTTSDWVKAHAHLVNYRVEEGHKSARGLHG